MASNTPFKPKQDREYNVDQETVDAIIKKDLTQKDNHVAILPIHR